MIALLTAWLTSKLRLIEWVVMGLILLGTFYSGWHLRGIFYEAAASKQTTKLVEAAPKIITQTQILYKVLHDAKDPCSAAPVPVSVLERLR